MGTLAEMAREHTDLDEEDVGFLADLVGFWSLLADLSFSDLLLVAPSGVDVVVLAHVHPTTGPALYTEDRRGDRLGYAVRREVDASLLARRIVDRPTVGSRSVDTASGWTCIPVVHRGRGVAGILRQRSATGAARRPGSLEAAYSEVFDRLARMVADGRLSVEAMGAASGRVPRVGDGVLVLDAEGTVQFASPNAVRTLHGLGVHQSLVGADLARSGLDLGVVDRCLARGEGAIAEVEGAGDAVAVVRCLPLLDDTWVTGVVMLVRDVSELARADQLLRSKDVMIREIHHRVKNNLQTISALLRLQSRRSDAPEVTAALEESVQRIAAIALVHDALSRGVSDELALHEVLVPLLGLAEDHLGARGARVKTRIEGDPGTVPGAVATPLSVVANELIQNCVDHAAPDGRATLTLTVSITRDGEDLVLTVADDGAGLPEGADPVDRSGLGLTIVGTLVESELNGCFSLGARPGGGTVATVTVPVVSEGGLPS